MLHIVGVVHAIAKDTYLTTDIKDEYSKIM